MRVFAATVDIIETGVRPVGNGFFDPVQRRISQNASLAAQRTEWFTTAKQSLLGNSGGGESIIECDGVGKMIRMPSAQPDL